MTEPLFTRLADSRLKRFLLAIASGALLALAFPSMSWWLLLFIAPAPLIYALLSARRGLEAFLLGWAAAAVTWLINVQWTMGVMTKYGGISFIVASALLVGLALYLGVFGCLFGVAVFYAGKIRRGLLAIPLAWAASEYLRTKLLTQNPWNLTAAALVDFPQLAMMSRWIGPYATAALVLVSSTLLAVLLIRTSTRRTRLLFGIGYAVFLATWIAAGSIETAREDRRATAEAKNTAALLQPNISQEERWDDSTVGDIFSRMIEMTREAAGRGADVIVWPESTIPLTYSTTDLYREAIETLSRSEDVDIILGSVAQDPKAPDRLWNAAYLVSGGKTAGRYDKIKLVPFGEYVPLRKMLFFAEKMVRQVGTFQFGSNDRPLDGKFRYGPAICYEIAFPRIPATQVKHGANVLVTITNDAWFGRSAAPRQHLDSARLRAIETDRYVLRSATTGISALIDPAGRIVREIPLDERGIIVGTFGTRQTVTPYVRFGDWFAVLALCVTVAVGAWGCVESTRSPGGDQVSGNEARPG